MPCIKEQLGEAKCQPVYPYEYPEIMNPKA